VLGRPTSYWQSMPTLISSVLGVDHDDLNAAGVFDSFVDLDSALHVDPHLLEASEAREFVEAYKAFQNHFVGVMTLLKQSKAPDDPLWRNAVRRLIFPELPGVGLGYSRKRSKGSAIGLKIAKDLVKTADAIIKAGVDDPAVFELAGLLEKNIGPDRVSDMTLHVILPHVAQYTQRIAQTFGISTDTHKIRGVEYQLPTSPHKKKPPLLLLPQDVLRDLPIAETWSEIDVVGQYAAELREEVNKIIGESWKKATGAQVAKETLLETLLEHPELFYELIDAYKAKAAIPYDFSDDPLAEQRRYFEAVLLAKQHPLGLAVPGPLTLKGAQDIVIKICEHFGKLLEHNGLNELLYNQKKQPLRERAAQRLFFGIAHAYCVANDLDLSPESNAGRGPIDFKATKGGIKVGVEMKLSTHTRLAHGYEKQLPIYLAAESAAHGVFLIVRVNDKTTHINAVLKLEQDAIQSGGKPPRVMVVDARLKPSASK
jgi:hypothetical protein